MCGIMGYVGPEPAWPILVTGLKRLEYRGYDSAGIATIEGQTIHRARRVGPLASLERAFPEGVGGSIGIGHTRWATHGVVTEANCHPHTDDRKDVAIVHNGIIDNAEELRSRLIESGRTFESDTDSEVLAMMISVELEKTEGDLLESVRRVLCEVEGTAGLVVLHRAQPDRLIAARLGSPVVVGLGDDACWVSSDQLGLATFTNRVVVLDDGEVAQVMAGRVRTVDLDRRDRQKRIEAIEASATSAELGEWSTFMEKEIAEQPQAIDRTLRGRVSLASGTARLGGLTELGRRIFDVQRVVLFGCGTSLHSAQVGRYLIERFARLPTAAEDAAALVEFNPVVRPDALYIAVSQSGETADTLVAVRELKRRGAVVAGITNVVGSSLARETDCGVYMHAGAEISVCSTKAFTAQVAALTLIALRLGRIHHLSPGEGRLWAEGLLALPKQIASILEQESKVEAWAREHGDAKYMMFIGRGASAPVAREGALKLREIAYIPADGLSGAEMKHGPLALISEGTPVWVIIPPDENRDRMLGNLHELRARGAHIMAVMGEGDEEVANLCQGVITLPPHPPALSPMLSVIPLQHFAYHVARVLGRNIDRPRNLAKSVTVL